MLLQRNNRTSPRQPKELTMSPQNTGYDVPPEMRDFAEKSVEQARKAVDGFMSAAQKTVGTLESTAETAQASTKDLARKTFTYAEQNIAAAFDLAQRLIRAKDPQEALQLQAEFVRSQFSSLQSQMKEFGTMAQGAMQNAASQARPKE
jgi:phasin